MNKNIKKCILNTLLLILTISISAQAQCPNGQTEIIVEINAVSFGSEMGWELVDATSNTVIACQPSGTYSTGTVVQEGPFCVPNGNTIELVGYDNFGDDWNGGYFNIIITEDGSVNGCGTQDGCVALTNGGEDLDVEPDVSITNSCETSNQEFTVTLPVFACTTNILGCTDPNAINYNSCATTDDNSCLLPAVNDECVDAISITPNPDLSCGTLTPGTIVGATDSGVTTSCFGTSDDDVWFSFVATSTVHNIDLLNITGTTTDLYHAVIDACSGGTDLVCSDPNSSTVTGLTVGNTYYLQVYSWTSTPGQETTFDVCIGTPPPPPSNDECVDAAPLCGEPVMGTIIEATTNPNDLITSCIGSLENTVWYSFEADASGDPITIDISEDNCIGGNGLQVHILSGDCTNGFFEEDCTSIFSTGNVYSLNLAAPIPGDIYYVYIDGNGGAQCDFTITQTGVASCCGPTVDLSASCQIPDEDNFYVEIALTDLGANPSGYIVNGGAFPNITATGTYTVGPFPNGTATINLEGIDDPACLPSYSIDGDCTCPIGAVDAGTDVTVCPGAPVTLEATLGQAIQGECLGTYTVSNSAIGSCTAVPNVGTTSVILGDDNFQGPIPLPFPFEYFCNTYEELYIGSNGFISFGAGSSSLGNTAIPSTGTPNDMIALYWDDLDPGNGADGTVSIFTSTIGGQTCFVVEFNGVPHFPGPPSETVTGQIILCIDGTITINCIDCQADGGNGSGSATQGIENSDGTIGYADPALVDGQTTDDLANCVTFTPDYTVDTTCVFVEWQDDQGNVVGTTPTVTVSPTTVTTYTAIVDCEGIPCSDQVVLNFTPPLVIECDSSISQGSNGGWSPFYYNTYEICVGGGIPPYNYSWATTGYVRHAITDVGEIRIIYADNAYWSVTITDSSGCDDESFALVFSNDASTILDIDNYSITPATVPNTCTDGTINLTVGGGTPGYTYDWTGPSEWDGTGQGTATINNCPIGWYAVTVTDSSTPAETTMGWYWVNCSQPGRGKIANSNSHFTIYPNPTSSNTNVQFMLNTSGKVQLQLFDISGKEMKRLFEGHAEANAIQQISLSNLQLANGIYLLKLTTETGETQHQKLVIQ